MILFLLLSCIPGQNGGKNNNGDTGTTGTSTTTDSDADTDSDSDSDTDVEPCSSSLNLCATGDCIFDVNPQPVKLSGAVSYDGQTIPDTYGSSYQEWELQLVDTDTHLNYNYAMDGGSDTYKVDVYPGDYDVYFRLNYSDIFDGGITDLTRLGAVSIKHATTYDLNPAPLKLSGAVSYDGKSIPDTYGSSYQEWELHLVETTSGLSYDYALDGGSDKYKIDVYPGTYDVYFRLNYGDVFDGGITDLVRLDTVKVSKNTTFDVAPDPVVLSGNVSYGGQPIPDTYGSGYQEWELHLVDTTSGLSYDYAMDGGSNTYKVDVYPGTYDVYFRLNYSDVFDGGITDLVRLGTTTVKGNTKYDVTPAPVKMSGTVTYDGLQIPDTYGSSYQEWNLHLVDRSSGLSYDYPMDGGSNKYKIDVYPGSYEVYFRLNYSDVVDGGITDYGDLGKVTVTGNTTFNLAPAPVTLSGTITYDGKAIPDTYGSSYQEYQLQLVDLKSNLVYYYAMDGDKHYSVDVYPGTYDIYFRFNYPDVVEGGITDFFRIAEAVDLSASDTLALKPAGISLSGAVSYNNKAIPDTYGSSYQEWSLQLQDRDTHLSYTHDLDGAADYDVEVPAGVYDIYFRLNYADVVAGGITDWGRLQECGRIQ